MAKAKTGSFYIRRSLPADSTTPDVITIDTSAYVDPADRQGLMIESVDFAFYNASSKLPFNATSRQYAVQVLSGAYTDLQLLDEEDLIASGSLVLDADGAPSNDADMYPDALATQGGRIVVDDQITVLTKASTASSNMECAVIITAKVVTLSNKDYMALALQTVAN